MPATFPRSHRQNLRTARNRLDRLGRVAIRQVSGPDISPALDALFTLHAARWQQDGEAGVLADPLVQAFHRQAAPLLDAAGLLRLYALDLDGRTVAVLYGLAAKGRFHYYIGGHDPALAACSPGSLLLSHAIDRATAEGCTLFDFLRGQEPYKYRWGATDRPSHWRRFTRDLP
ncbi:GNAT family N-acetyltransferase [Aerophototrophica crusticola]|uniref:GNAT family N-acetyltransferase n=1 Tax=Aerophototrophica crusticola TaxID=1709002 RepID=A0A858R4S8_9PROT|nr:GNAT family N-acetyltransferase [Rhodospirillaceae bacterium B3]